MKLNGLDFFTAAFSGSSAPDFAVEAGTGSTGLLSPMISLLSTMDGAMVVGVSGAAFEAAAADDFSVATLTDAADVGIGVAAVGAAGVGPDSGAALVAAGAGLESDSDTLAFATPAVSAVIGV